MPPKKQASARVTASPHAASSSVSSPSLPASTGSEEDHEPPAVSDAGDPKRQCHPATATGASGRAAAAVAVDDSALRSALEDEDDVDNAAADASDGEADSSSGDSSDSEHDDLFADHTVTVAPAAATATTAPAATDDAAPAPKAPRKTVSAANLEFTAGHLTMLHVDIEHNGTHMISISGEVVEKHANGSFAPRTNLGPDTSLAHGQYSAGRYFHMFSSGC